jgi:hypothetical protein
MALPSWDGRQADATGNGSYDPAVPVSGRRTLWTARTVPESPVPPPIR